MAKDIAVDPARVIAGLRQHISNLNAINEELMFENIKLQAALSEATEDAPTDEDGVKSDA